MSDGFSIGGVTIPGRVLTAPMTGVSDLPFRRAASRLGAAYVATEMVACELLAQGRPDVVRRAAAVGSPTAARRTTSGRPCASNSHATISVAT